ncbi:MAG: hypothetical protein H0X46_07155 [Bacteroidetes bacterium]|nr:hypothetical protein [Bacteroidota bacterium]
MKNCTIGFSKRKVDAAAGAAVINKVTKKQIGVLPYKAFPTSMIGR